MIGPFSTPPFSPYRISPIGVTTRKYSGKKCLIIDLLIPSSDFHLSHDTVDHAIALIKLAGRSASLSKADIISAFKVLPLHPDFWHLFGVFWDGKFYFSVRLAFGCKSSPKIFNTLAEALCWILLNVQRLPFVLHLLDDFLIIDPPSAPPARGLTALSDTFHRLGIPLSDEKTLGPSTSLEFLGITLDSVLFQASLPQEKHDRITQSLSAFLSSPTCTKQQLLTLLGHLNYVTWIIPQGRSFISHLLHLASSVQTLHHTVMLDDSCLLELKFWLALLHHWNGISFFYKDIVGDPADIQLFTDAAPSTGFRGYYNGCWFASPWPTQFIRLASGPDNSSALWELYPVVVAALLWGHTWTEKAIQIHLDNLATVHTINKGRSRTLSFTPFIRRLTWHSVMHKYILRAVHVPGRSNAIADSLSRFQFQKFRSLAPQADQQLVQPLQLPVKDFPTTPSNISAVGPPKPTTPTSALILTTSD
ncbi:uncharacterized protein [Salminus brasiliensis]|uniref:uncharacterized protein n=1 Tax=Salminus brasiliensis TaxID=930266 RepID=UPI003B836E5C